MAAGERITVSMTGGGPWGFRLYGGDDEPLVIAKMRQRSKAADAGLAEGDALLSIHGTACSGMSHGTAMGLIDAHPDLSLIILRGASDKHVVNAAVQALGSNIRQAPSNLAPVQQSQAPSSRLSPAPSRSPQTRSPVPTQNEQQVVNGYGSAPQYKREQQTFNDNDSTTHVTTETSREQRGGTTVTTVKRETHTQYKPNSMFKVSNIAANVPKSTFTEVPGIWKPSNVPTSQTTKFKVNAPSNVQVQENPDQSVTMTIGFGGESRQENAPQRQPDPPLFKVSKFGQPKPEQQKPIPAMWKPGRGQEQHLSEDVDDSSHFPLLPDEEASLEAHVKSLKNPIPPHLQRVLFCGSDGSREGTPDSPGYFSRRRIEEFGTESEEESNKRKMFSDSAFYDDPEHKYPTIEEQVKMARKVAMSLLAPANKKARGHRMFMRRMVKAQKWTTDDEKRENDFDWTDEEEEEKYYNPNPWAQAASVWEPPKSDPRAAKFTGIPAAPPIPTNFFSMPTLPSGPRKEEKAKALSAEEFERMRLFEKKTDHTQVSPAMCFSLAEDLRNMKGRGGKLFAKRVARAEKWDEDDHTMAKPPNHELIQRIAMQAAADGAKPMPMPGMVRQPLKDTTDSRPDGGPVVNRLKGMIDPPKPKMTPWDAAASYEGCTDAAFEHLKGYNPYGKSMQGEIVSNLDTAIKNVSQPIVAPLKQFPTSGQPAKLPEYTRKIKPWGSSDQSASGASFSAPRPAAAAPSSGPGFRPVSFKAPIGGASSYIRASPAPSGGGAASGDEVGYCDL